MKGDSQAGIVHIAHSIKMDPEVEEVLPCKFLHLHSEHHALASDLHRYIKLAYRSVLVEVYKCFFLYNCFRFLKYSYCAFQGS